MAVGTTSPVKILLDLGIDLDNLSSEEDYLSALKEGAAILQVGGKTDERFKILADEVRRVRSDRKEADPTFKTRKVSINKLMNRKGTSTQKVSPQKLLPAATEEDGEKNQTIITSNLADRLNNIHVALKGLGLAFRRKLVLEKRDAALEERNRKEGRKLQQEKKLETKKNTSTGGLGFAKLAKPVTGFFGTILNFFKNIFIGSILVQMLDWMDDNKPRIEEFSEFFSDNAPLIIGGIAALTAASILPPVLGLGQLLLWGGGIVAASLKFFGRSIGGLWRGLRGLGGPKPNLRLGGPSRGITRGNWFTRGLNRINPLRKPATVTTGGNWLSRFLSKVKPSKVTGVKPSGIKPGGIPVLGTLFGLFDFGMRKAEGQTNLQAASGAGSGWLGGLAGAALAATLFPEPASSAVGLITLGVLGTLGYNVGGMISDQVTGVNDDVNQSVSKWSQSKAQVAPSTTTPPITSPTGTGNIQVLDMRTGGQQASVVSGGNQGGKEEVPSFSSSDPNNLTTVTVRSIYGLVN